MMTDDFSPRQFVSPSRRTSGIKLRSCVCGRWQGPPPHPPPPHVTAREFLGPTVIDAGWNAEACSKATMQALTNVCRVESGRRAAGRHDLTGEGDYIDEALLAHVRSVIVAGTSDGAVVELQGIHRLKVIGELLALRYQFRDKAHVTRCVLKGTLKHAGRGADMMEALISGPNAFAKKCDTLVALNSCGWKHRKRRERTISLSSRSCRTESIVSIQDRGRCRL